MKSVDYLIRKIVLILCEVGQNDPQFKIGDLIQYTPASVAAILANHKDELYDVVYSSKNIDGEQIKGLIDQDEAIARLNTIYPVNPNKDDYTHGIAVGIAMSKVAIKEQKNVQSNIIKCKDCKYWVPGYISDSDDFIPPKCDKYKQFVGHSNDDYCSFAERK